MKLALGLSVSYMPESVCMELAVAEQNKFKRQRTVKGSGQTKDFVYKRKALQRQRTPSMPQGSSLCLVKVNEINSPVFGFSGNLFLKISKC